MIENRSEVLDLLKRALEIEYTIIIYYPRMERMVENDELRGLVNILGEGSLRHAHIVSLTIRELGEEPPFFDISPFPDWLTPQQFFEQQLEYERLALSLHTQAAEVVGESLSAEMGRRLREIAAEEEWHITLVEKILARLGAAPGPQ